MNIVFVSNYMSHHQLFLSNELYEITGGHYSFIATEPISDERLKMGWQRITAPYIIEVDNSNKECVMQIIRDANVVVIGSAPYSYIAEAAKSGKLIFKYGERIYKEGAPWWRVLVHRFRYRKQFHPYKNIYKLCASAFAPLDYSLTNTFIDKCYRWGYFTEAKKYDSVETLIRSKGNSKVSILWTSRLIDWKHPEIPVLIAEKLKNDGIAFQMNMIGVGPLEESINSMIATKGLKDCVTMLGAMKPEQVREQMEKSNVFLFTSDKNEGWGAVLNESMNSGCAVVASSAIGAVPFLIKDGDNGIIYRDGDLEDLYTKLKSIIQDSSERARIGINAYYTIINDWSPRNAAKRLVSLSNALLDGDDCNMYEEGPCSKAPILKDKWY